MQPLSEAQKHHILRLLGTGMSQAEAARTVGVGQRTVARVGRGYARRFTVPDDPPPGYDVEKLVRCPGCGGLNYLHPCLRCRLNNQQVAPAKVPRNASRTTP